LADSKCSVLSGGRRKIHVVPLLYLSHSGRPTNHLDIDSHRSTGHSDVAMVVFQSAYDHTSFERRWTVCGGRRARSERVWRHVDGLAQQDLVLGRKPATKRSKKHKGRKVSPQRPQNPKLNLSPRLASCHAASDARQCTTTVATIYKDAQSGLCQAAREVCFGTYDAVETEVVWNCRRLRNALIPTGRVEGAKRSQEATAGYGYGCCFNRR
jgi:hypothetical protein